MKRAIQQIQEITSEIKHPNKWKHDRRKIICDIQKYACWNNYGKLVTNVITLKQTIGIVTLSTDESNSFFCLRAKLKGGLLSVSSMFQLNQYSWSTVIFPNKFLEQCFMKRKILLFHIHLSRPTGSNWTTDVNISLFIQHTN